jgi:hypothetical protein
MFDKDRQMNNWIFLSKEGKDQYINMFALGSGGRVVIRCVLPGVLLQSVLLNLWNH